MDLFHRRWLTSEAGTMSCSSSENCGISACWCWITPCTPGSSPGRGVENVPSAGEPTDGTHVLRGAEKASLSKQVLGLNVLQYELVFESLKHPTALLSITPV